ncbi:hypothetical protein AUL39_05295 [Tractidigestivibacter scatoligenes]|uniref:UPF0102 protein AUL39_05295 n=1 Tax=Tractidigestivibacter scatoligenes TaxID=1299998 RepID=A0A100YVF3_TRASO|nr:YraN family protein [Tractidigestivibacter scatoligenes]KUH58417.1 hypothetical protein AUL39_05295 [Tractidigestivibacter scatoligenes]
MRDTTFGAQGMPGWSRESGPIHSEYCYGHIAWDPDEDGFGYSGQSESRYFEFDGAGDPSIGLDLPRKPLEEYTTKELGVKGERIAASYLASHGFRILEMNWRCKAGEVDIVATMDEPDEDLRRSVVLIEVKTRLALGDEADYMPEIAVDPKKRNKYRLLGLLYLVDHTDVDSVRFDVVAVNITRDEHAELRHLVCAFSWDD